MPMPSEEKLFSTTSIAQDFSESSDAIEGAKELKDTIITLEQQTANGLKLTKNEKIYNFSGGFSLYKLVYHTLIPLYKRAEELTDQLGNTMKIYGKNFGNISKKLKDYLVKFNYIRDTGIDICKRFRSEGKQEYELMGELLTITG